MAAHPLLVKAAQLIEQARAIKEEYADDPTRMPADVAQTQDRLLLKASELRKSVERDAHLADLTKFLEEPEYKHDMTGGDAIAREIGHGTPLLESEKRERQSKAFWSWVKFGEKAMQNEVKADLVEDATGEILVPTDFAGAVLADLPREGVLRALAFVRPTTSNKVDIAPITEGTVGWGKLETGGALYDATPAPTSDQIEVHDLNGMVKVGRDELEDSAENLTSLFNELVTRQFAEAEDDAFANGSGTGQPEGLAANVGSTLPAAAGETVDAVELARLPYEIPEQYRRNGVYLAHSSAEVEVSVLQDSNGQFLWQPNTAAGEPATFKGKRWYTLDGLPSMTTTVDAGAGTDRSVLFADVRAAYMVADRRRITVQRLDERYAEQGKVGFLFTHRVGGGVIRPVAAAAYLL